MTAIAWAIFCAAIMIKPNRLITDPHYEFNNVFDAGLFFVGLAFLIYYSVKS